MANDERGTQGVSVHNTPGETPDNARWFAVWTRSHCEQLVHDQLNGKGFQTFLPKINTWSRRKKVQSVISLPMFSGYVFLHHFVDKPSYVEILKARGLVRILGERWDRLTPIPDGEIEAIQRIARTDATVLPHPYLREGQRVRLTDGPLAGIEGILVCCKPHKGLVVLSVDLLQRSVAVEVDCTQVVPVAGPVVAARSSVRPNAPSVFDHV